MGAESPPVPPSEDPFQGRLGLPGTSLCPRLPAQGCCHPVVPNPRSFPVNPAPSPRGGEGQRDQRRRIRLQGGWWPCEPEGAGTRGGSGQRRDPHTRGRNAEVHAEALPAALGVQSPRGLSAHHRGSSLHTRVGTPLIQRALLRPILPQADRQKQGSSSQGIASGPYRKASAESVLPEGPPEPRKAAECRMYFRGHAAGRHLQSSSIHGPLPLRDLQAAASSQSLLASLSPPRDPVAPAEAEAHSITRVLQTLPGARLLPAPAPSPCGRQRTCSMWPTALSRAPPD